MRLGVLLAICLATVASSAEAQRRVARSARSRGILVHEGRAMQSFGGGPGGSEMYAEVLNEVRAAVGDRATIYSIIVPTAEEFYLPDRADRERRNILGTYGRLDRAIRTVDAHAELAAHTDENIYFRTDTHWTGLAGYYAYRAFCAAAGLTPVPLERMERRVLRTGWLGSLYRITRDPTLRPDDVEIVVPPVQVRARAQGRGGGPERDVPLFAMRSPGYSVFLGGDHPIMRVTTPTNNGRRVILVKNSYGNAFAPHLVSHYQELVFVDYRTFAGSILALLDESDMPTDLLFMNGSLTSNSRVHSRMIREVLRGR
jgi:hypothetical protein